MKNKKTSSKSPRLANRGQTNAIIVGVLAAILIFVIVGFVGIYLSTKNILNPSVVTIPAKETAGPGSSQSAGQEPNVPADLGKDSDGDGVPDEVEKILGTDPNRAEPKPAPAATGTEQIAPAPNPSQDTDGDGVPDEVEKILGTDPNRTEPKPAVALIPSPTGTEQIAPAPNPSQDTDGDGVPDEVEKILGTDPNKKDN